MAHLDLPFIRLEMVSFLDVKPPWWLADGNENSCSSQQDKKKNAAKNDGKKVEEKCYGYSKTDKQINLATQVCAKMGKQGKNNKYL